MTAPSKLPAAAAGSATDLFPVSQGCTGSPPTATGGQTNSMTGAQLKAWALGTPAAGGVHPTGAAIAGPASNAVGMAGLGGRGFAFTPNRSGNVLLIVTLTMAPPANPNVSDGIWAGLYYGTGTAPAAGAAATGTLSNCQAYTYFPSATVVMRYTMTLAITLTGLTVGTPYWFDIGQAWNNASQAAWNYVWVSGSWLEQ